MHNDVSDCYKALSDNRENFIAELHNVKRACGDLNIDMDMIILNCDSCHMNDMLYFAEYQQNVEVASITLQAYADCVAEVFTDIKVELLFYGNPRHPKLQKASGRNTVYDQVCFIEKTQLTLPDNINIRFVSGCALNYDNIERNVTWNPQGGICHMMGKPKSERVEIVKSLLHNPDFQFTMAHPEWSKGGDYELTDSELLGHAQVDPNIKLNMTHGLPNGYQTPEFLYNQSCCEVTVETMPMCGVSYLTEKTWRGWIEGMPWFGTEYEENNAHSMGMLSYFDIVDSDTQADASAEFVYKLRHDTNFISKVQNIRQHNQKLAHEYLNLMRISLPPGDHTLHYGETVALPSILRHSPDVNITYQSYHQGTGL